MNPDSAGAGDNRVGLETDPLTDRRPVDVQRQIGVDVEVLVPRQGAADPVAEVAGRR